MRFTNITLLLTLFSSAAFSQEAENPLLIYPLVADVLSAPFSSIGTLGDGTAELIRKDLVITAAHVATELVVSSDEFIPGASSQGSNPAPYGRYKVKEVIFSTAFRNDADLMEHIKTGCKYWEAEAMADFALVRIEPIDFVKTPRVRVLEFSDSDPCSSAKNYYLTGYPALWPRSNQRSNTVSFAGLGCNSDKSLIYFNGLTVRGFSGGLISESKSADAKIIGMLVAGGRAPGSGRCSNSELGSVGAQKCGLWAIPAAKILEELKQIP